MTDPVSMKLSYSSVGDQHAAGTTAVGDDNDPGGPSFPAYDPAGFGYPYSWQLMRDLGLVHQL
jgi:hypothetical protein